MTSTDTLDTRIRLGSPGDLLSAVPYLLGYRPIDSLVLVGLHDRTVAVTARLALPPPHEPADGIAEAAQALLHNDTDATVVVGYGPAVRVTRCIDAVIPLLRHHGLELVDALRVTDGRYWSYLCDDLDCCPMDGTAVPGPDSPVDAAFVAGGMTTAPRRQDRVDLPWQPVTGEARRIARRTARRLRRVLDDTDTLLSPLLMLGTQAIAMLDAADPNASLPTPEKTVRLAIALEQDTVRHRAAAWVDTVDPRQAVRWWLWVTRHSDPPYRAEPAALLGYAAWRSGDGVIAESAVRMALSDDPTCRLAVELRPLLAAGVTRRGLPELVSQSLLDGSVRLGREDPVKT